MKINYAEYKMENMALVNVALSEINMTLEEKKEFLFAFYGSNDGIINELTSLVKAIDSGEVKISCAAWSSDINGRSLQAWIKRNNIKHITYADSYITIYWAKNKYKNYKPTKHNIEEAIRIFNDYDSIFANLLSSLKREEVEYYEKNKEENYKKENVKRIKSGDKTYELLRKCRISIPYAITEISNFPTWNRYEITETNFCDSWSWSGKRPIEERFSSNKYKELTYTDGNETKILSAEKADEISELLLKYGRKFSVLIDEMRDELKEIVERKEV